jgi:hypothetical protein
MYEKYNRNELKDKAAEILLILLFRQPLVFAKAAPEKCAVDETEEAQFEKIS